MSRRHALTAFFILAFLAQAVQIQAEEPDLNRLDLTLPGESTTAGAALTEVLQVGSLADPEKLMFEGVTLFPERELRDALAMDLKYQAAARPSYDTSKYLEILEKRLQDGYLHSGCPNARVLAWRDSLRTAFTIHVVEGSRFMQGDIHVSGPDEFDKSALVKWLTTPQGARRWRYEYGHELVEDLPEDPVAAWTPGKAAQFDTIAKGDLDVAIRTALIELGYPYVRPTYAMIYK